MQRGTAGNCYYQTSDNTECHQGIGNVNHFHIAGGKVMYFSSVGNTMIVYCRVAYKPPTQLITFTCICLENWKHMFAQVFCKTTDNKCFQDNEHLNIIHISESTNVKVKWEDLCSWMFFSDQKEQMTYTCYSQDISQENL